MIGSNMGVPHGSILGLCLLCNSAASRSITTHRSHLVPRYTRSVNNTGAVGDTPASEDDDEDGRVVALVVIFSLLFIAFITIAILTYCYFRRGRQYIKEARRKTLLRGQEKSTGNRGTTTTKKNDMGFSNPIAEQQQNGSVPTKDPFCVLRTPIVETNNNTKSKYNPVPKPLRQDSGEHKKEEQPKSYGEYKKEEQPKSYLSNGSIKRSDSQKRGVYKVRDDGDVSKQNELSVHKKTDRPTREETDNEDSADKNVEKPVSRSNSARVNRRESTGGGHVRSMARLARRNSQKDNPAADQATSGVSVSRQNSQNDSATSNIDQDNMLTRMPSKGYSKSKLPPLEKEEQQKPKKDKRAARRERKNSEHAEVYRNPNIIKVNQSEPDIRKSIELEEGKHTLGPRRHSFDVLNSIEEKDTLNKSGPVPIEAFAENCLDKKLKTLGLEDPNNDIAESFKAEADKLRRNRKASSGSNKKVKRSSSDAKPSSGRKELRRNHSLHHVRHKEEAEEEEVNDSNSKVSDTRAKRRHSSRRHKENKEEDEKREERKVRREKYENMTEEEKKKYREQRRKQHKRHQKQREKEEEDMTAEEKEEKKRRRRHRKHRRRHQELRQSLEGNSIAEDPEEDAHAAMDDDVNNMAAGSDEGGNTSAWDSSCDSDSNETDKNKPDKPDKKPFALPESYKNTLDLKLDKTKNSPDPYDSDTRSKNGDKRTPRKNSNFEVSKPSIPKPTETTPKKTVSSKFTKVPDSGDTSKASVGASIASNYTYVTDNFDSVDLDAYLAPSFDWESQA